MSPERTGSVPNILEEAQRIEYALLAVEAEVDLEHSNHLAEKLRTIRDSLGYKTPDVAKDDHIVDTRIATRDDLVSPGAVKEALPLTQQSAVTTLKSRQAISEILAGDNDRIMVIVGPCSIHDPSAALEYASYVKEMREKYGDDLEIIMRAYSEKPRTELGWKGFVNDPLLDGTNRMNLGLIADRMLALHITGMGVPIARERLNIGTPQYVDGLVAYDSIGARNVEDSNARAYASGTSSPIGLKNATDGSVDAAVSACVAANGKHAFIGRYPNGKECLITTSGNNQAHIILRGGAKAPNFNEKSVNQAVEKIKAKNESTGLHIPEGVMVDLSHKNKVDGEQRPAAEEVARQIELGSTAIFGVMIESNLQPGTQKLDPANLESLEYGVSITDACIDLNETTTIIELLASAVRKRRILAAS